MVQPLARPDVSGELGATLRVDAPRVSNGSPRLSSMNPSRLSDTATTQAAHARQLDSMKNLLLNFAHGRSCTARYRAPHAAAHRTTIPGHISRCPELATILAACRPPFRQCVRVRLTCGASWGAIRGKLQWLELSRRFCCFPAWLRSSQESSSRPRVCLAKANAPICPRPAGRAAGSFQRPGLGPDGSAKSMSGSEISQGTWMLVPNIDEQFHGYHRN